MKTHWLDEPRNVRLLWRIFVGVLALTVLAEPFVRLHPHFLVERLFGFYAWYGLLGCVVMILFAKLLGAALKRPDDYYEDAGEGRRDERGPTG